MTSPVTSQQGRAPSQHTLLGFSWTQKASARGRGLERSCPPHGPPLLSCPQSHDSSHQGLYEGVSLTHWRCLEDMLEVFYPPARGSRTSLSQHPLFLLWKLLGPVPPLITHSLLSAPHFHPLSAEETKPYTLWLASASLLSCRKKRMSLGKAETEFEVRLGCPVLGISLFLPGLPTILDFRFIIYLFIHSFISKGKLDSTRD